MRDLETFQAAVLAGQVGHFNLSTLHIHSPGEAIPRCLTMVPSEMREATAHDLLSVLQYIIVQKLLRTTDGKRQAVREYIIFDDALRAKLASMPYPPNGADTSTPSFAWSNDASLIMPGDFTWKDALTGANWRWP
nr:hypothetical protein pPsy0462b_00008 [Pseudomonas syringae]